MEEHSRRKDSYVIDPTSGAEMARLIDQDNLVTRHMNGLFPEEVDLSTIGRVLDLACGPGGWVQEVAFHHQNIEVTGVDISRQMIDYARALTSVQGLDNAHFDVMDIRKPFDFDDDSFDFVNARFLVGVFSPGDWPGFLAECKRILRPGGIMRLTETDDLGISNSQALERLTELAVAAGRKTGRAFFPYGRFSGTMSMTGTLLRRAGFQDIHQQAHIMDWSVGTTSNRAQYDNIRILFMVGRPFVLGTGVVKEEEYDALYNHAMIEMLGEDFCATMIYLSAWGRK